MATRMRRVDYCAPVLLILFSLLAAIPTLAGYPLLEAYEDGSRDFREVEIGDDLIVYYHQRMIDNAVVERDYIVYQFDKQSGELLARKAHWRDDLPEHLSTFLLPGIEAESMVAGEIQSSRLYIISPESDVFPIVPPPQDPCWVVRSIQEVGMTVSIFSAVDGRFLGHGVPPPYTAFSLTGPIYFNPCESSWDPWSESAAMWFDIMGYSTEHVVWPEEDQIRAHIQSTETAMFYELAHGGSDCFSSGCIAGQDPEHTYASEIESWIYDYEKMPFAFIGSCSGMCSTTNGSFSYEFRKGSENRAVTVGYCGMANPDCADCWDVSLLWQETLFYCMSLGITVKDAFNQANADFPACALADCMRFAGDEEFAVVPVVQRASSWANATSGPLGDEGHGMGVAWGDYDSDGNVDLYLTNNGANRLLRNEGGGSFADATAGPLADPGDGRGAAWGDYDRDGDLDLYLANYGSANKLLRNEGSGVFSDATGTPLGDTGCGTGIAWGDYDNDGDLDLYLANHGSANKLFRNDGNGTFIDVTDQVLGDEGNGMGVAWGDYDNDGDPDLYLANNGGPNKLFRNDGNDTFMDATSGPLGDAGFGRGVAWADYDNDERLDLYVTNFNGPNKLFHNEGGGVFTDATSGPLGDAGPGTGVAWADYNNDENIDLYLANYGSANQLLRNEGAGVFVESADELLGDPGPGNGVAWADFDNDGDLDLYLVNNAASNKLFRNDLSSEDHWLLVNLEGTVSDRFGTGARLRLFSGDMVMIREVSGGSGYMSQNSSLVEFGVGPRVWLDSLLVEWPSGVMEVVRTIASDQVITVVETDPSGLEDATVISPTQVIHCCLPNPFISGTAIMYDLPRSSSVSLRVFNAAGRVVRTLLVDAPQDAGYHTKAWDGRDEAGSPLPAGAYFYRLIVNGRPQSSQILLVR
ncbi:MAG: VCBS repeat-containing protein [Candidatus Eisenbacteria sp.]|nr:VCBS repeat-containing protein [Candidatus Eisenbacteria bacterium]